MTVSALFDAVATSGAANHTLESHGFKLVRTLAERDGLLFVEGVKPRAG